MVALSCVLMGVLYIMLENIFSVFCHFSGHFFYCCSLYHL